jgi:SAM-dependent methyltransferase
VNPGEYEIMARVEESHWWYRGLRDCVVRCLGSPRLALPRAPRILDAGCGTGGNLAAWEAAFRPSYLAGFDLSAAALEWARRRAGSADLSQADICDPQLRETGFDLVTSMDVVYIPGAENALPGLRQIVGALRPGGLFVMNLPAYEWLYSGHDAALATRERYTTRRVRSLMERIGLRVELLSYRLCALLPAVVLARLPTLLGARPEASAARSDLHAVPGPWVSRMGLAILRAENVLIARGAVLPWGSSVFAVGRRPAG